jgi:hypothetical protein
MVVIMVMLGDIMLLAACITVIRFCPILGIILTCLTYNTWKGQGGLIAWNKSHRNQFLQNAKRIGI